MSDFLVVIQILIINEQSRQGTLKNGPAAAGEPASIDLAGTAR
jgi:hypothetical protein